MKAALYVLLAAARRVDWARMAEWVVLAGVLAIAALISYTHLRDVWRHAGAPWEDLGPLLPDGLFASAWLQMRRRRRQGVAVGWLAWLAGGVALLATLAGNIAAAVIDGTWTWLDIVVAAFPAAVLALAWELVTGHGRRSPGTPGADLEDPEDDLEASAPDEAVDLQEEDLERLEDRVARLVDVEGYGRLRLARALGVPEWEARDLIAAHRARQDDREATA